MKISGNNTFLTLTKGDVLAVIAPSAAAIAVITWLAGNDAVDFHQFLGAVNPAAAAAAAGVISVLSMSALKMRGVAKIVPQNLRVAFVVSFVASLSFAVAVIAVDVVIGYPQALNVGWRWAWLFYPAIAVVAEAAFHLAPLMAIGLFLSGASQRTNGLPVILLVLVAAIEPLFQLKLAVAAAPLGVVDIYTMLHVFAFGIVQLLVFLRHGYVAMLMMRIFYYLFWHVLWGAARLHLIF